jgi:hypothetical protein
MARVASTCEQCGQTDDHPKVHIGPVTKHHDCLSHRERAMVVDGAEDPALAEDIIAACEGGKRGEKLLAHIKSVHKEG